ncbi:protein CASP-like [Dysidea avara]|uniref:protein CASP-like n=1 Tax=Dysidea avara TaxID=196820 RepID=UPI003325C22F
MTAIEALRLQLDNLQKEKQELEVKLLQIQPDAEAIVEIEQERDLWKEKYEGVVVENSQLRVMYEELLKYNSQEEQLKQEEVNVKQWKSKCEEFSFISTA